MNKIELAIDAARNDDMERVIKLLEAALAEQAECKECGAKQAQIDRLMLEYCPDEMTPEQMQEWGNNQRPAEQAEREPVAYLRMGSDQRFVVTKAAEELVADKFHELYTHPVRTKDLTDEQKQLARFYQVETLSELVAAMEKHIEKLQARIEYQPVYLRTPREG